MTGGDRSAASPVLPAEAGGLSSALAALAGAGDWAALFALATSARGEGGGAESRFYAARAAGRLGRHQEAAGRWAALVREFPGDAALRIELSNALADAGDPAAALRALRRAARLDPQNPVVPNNMALLYQALGRPAEAARCLEQAAALAGDSSGILMNLALARFGQRRLPEAIELLRRALAADPANVDARYLLGQIHCLRQENAEAVTHYRAALAQAPENAPVSMALAFSLQELDRFEEALEASGKALALAPSPKHQVEAADICLTAGFHTRAARLFRSAMESDPASVKAAWGHCVAHLPIVFEDEQEIERSHKWYGRHLARLRDGLRLDTPERAEAAYQAFLAWYPFYLGYQGLDATGLQKTFGGMVHEVMQARFPELAALPPPDPPKPGEPLRVGVVSAYFHNHTVWKLFLNGWMSRLRRDALELHAFSLGWKVDATTENSRPFFRSWTPYQGALADTLHAIAALRPHVLLYPEIGMHALAGMAAGLRLAPLQAVSWGHPVTTGLPTMDCFLTSDLMEPADGDEHYSERLVRLPDLAICYLPQTVAGEPPGRGGFGLPEGAVLYQCTQSLFKYLPRHDWVYPAIAGEVPGACFVFLQSRSPVLTERFRLRLERAFAARGQDAGRHVRFLPRLPQSAYLALHRVTDVYLDSLEWSGGNTTLEALNDGLPMVTLPGRFMRGRHTAAILRKAGVTGGIARDEREYVEIAVALGRDAARRRSMSADLLAGRERVYGDEAPLRALEEFLLRAR